MLASSQVKTFVNEKSKWFKNSKSIGLSIYYVINVCVYKHFQKPWAGVGQNMMIDQSLKDGGVTIGQYKINAKSTTK